jgi:hypothetical protein
MTPKIVHFVNLLLALVLAGNVAERAASRLP